MSLADILVTNRTQADVSRAKYLLTRWDPVTMEWTGTEKEKAEWDEGPIGFYNAKDLNRVIRAVWYLKTKLWERGYGAEAPVNPAYMIEVEANPPRSGIASSNIYYNGETATVRAIPIGESKFLHWLENGTIISTDKEITFTVNSNRTLTAEFEAWWVITSSVVGGGRIGKAVLGRRA